jgi:hypothetical protein
VNEDRGLLADLVRRSIYGYEHMEAAIARLRAAVGEAADVSAMLEKIRRSSQGDPALIIDQLTSIGGALSRPNLCDPFADTESWRVVRPETIRRCAELTLTP